MEIYLSANDNGPDDQMTTKTTANTARVTFLLITMAAALLASGPAETIHVAMGCCLPLALANLVVAVAVVSGLVRAVVRLRLRGLAGEEVNNEAEVEG